MATVIEPFANAMFEWSWRQASSVGARIGKMRKNFIRILAGDKWLWSFRRTINAAAASSIVTSRTAFRLSALESREKKGI